MIPEAKRKQKVADLADAFDMSAGDFIEASLGQETCYGICTNGGCNASRRVAADEKGYKCPRCGTKTIQSVLVLAGLL